MSNDSNTLDLLAMLFERLQAKEALELEVKSAQGGLPTSLWETVSAFANTSGGWILLGIKDADDSLTIEGLRNPSKLLDEFYSSLRNPEKISYPACGANDASIENLADKQIIVIRIVEASRQRRPVYIKNNPYKGTYVRRHTGDYLCTKPEVDRMMREASDVGADSAILPDFNLDDIDLDALARYRRLYQTLHPGEPRNTYDDIRFLEAIGGYRRERQTSNQGLTVAGLLLLGTSQSIRQWRTRHLIDYRLISDDNGSNQRWDDRVLWEGNLLGAFEEIYPRLTKGVASSFRLQGAIRVDESSVHEVLREALINLLVHADYATPEASLIKRAPSSFIFRNPGSSRISEIELLRGDRSDPRNPELVRMFRFIGLAEEAGSGIPKIIRAWRELGLEVPQIDTGTENYEFTLSLQQAHLLPSEDRRWLKGLGTQWSEVEQLALTYAKHNGYVDNSTLRRLSGQHSADVSRILVDLRNRDFLQRSGGGRYPRYELGPLAKTPNLVAPAATKKSPKPKPIDPIIWKQLLLKAEPIRQQKPTPLNDLIDMVLELCSQVPLSISELTFLLDRKKAYLRQRVIPKLLASGRIAFTNPELPSFTYQKYVTRKQTESDKPSQLSLELGNELSALAKPKK